MKFVELMASVKTRIKTMLQVDLCCLPLTNHKGSLNSSLFFWCCTQSLRQLCHLTTENFTCKHTADIWGRFLKIWGRVEICAYGALVLREIQGQERRNVLKTWQSFDKKSYPPRNQHMVCNCKMHGDTAMYSFLTEPRFARHWELILYDV